MTPDSGNGIFPESNLVAPAMVTDGPSHTAAFSKRLRGTGQPKGPSLERDALGAFGPAYPADDLLAKCGIAAQRITEVVFTDNGRWWFWRKR